MDITQIENLSAEELKGKKAELVESLENNPVKEVAERYVQARYDAKTRDEKLAEQGRTIVALQDGAESSKRHLSELEGCLGQAQKLASESSVREEQLNDRINQTTQALNEANQRADRLKTQANRNQAAVSGAAKLLTDAMSAQQIDSVDSGE